MTIEYDASCPYEFQAKARLMDFCISPALASNFSHPVTYGNRVTHIYARVHGLPGKCVIHAPCPLTSAEKLASELKCSSLYAPGVYRFRNTKLVVTAALVSIILSSSIILLCYCCRK